MIKVGAITIGQSPRTDVTQDILPLLGDQVELLQAGGLDGLSREEVKTFQPGPDDYVLISRLQDGSSVVFAERYILPRLQDCIDKLEAARGGNHTVPLHRRFPGRIPLQGYSGFPLQGSQRHGACSGRPRQDRRHHPHAPAGGAIGG